MEMINIKPEQSVMTYVRKKKTESTSKVEANLNLNSKGQASSLQSFDKHEDKQENIKDKREGSGRSR